MPVKPKKTTLRSVMKRQTGFGKAAHNELLGPIRTKGGSKNPNFKSDWVVSDVLAVSRNPAVIVDHVSDYVLAAHAEAIMRGEKADGSGPQARLRTGQQKEDAKRGKRKDARGILTGGFARNLTRGPISIKGGKLFNGDDATVARCRIKVMRPEGGKQPRDEFGNEADYTAFIVKESKAGIVYFFTTGRIEKGVTMALEHFFDLGIRGQVRDPDLGEYRAPKAKAS